ncbi:MAG: hypothetical protein JW809_12190 [Pirellulales bacterium]|nr:hypothetical protein [Pirellulales bacterium]
MDKRFAVISFLLLAAALPCCQLLAAETFEPASMSAEEFSRLSKVDQRDLLVRVFRQRLEHARNLEYSVDLSIRFSLNTVMENAARREARDRLPRE